MSVNYKELADQIFIRPIKKNLTLVLTVSGVAAIAVGALWDQQVAYLYGFIPIGTDEVLLKVGSAVLGAGVFSAIMKSSQFTDIFQNHIYDVFYNPSKDFDLESLKNKWVMITRAILGTTLPQAHSDASDRIMEQFMDDELQYHFEDFQVKYDVTVDATRNEADITHTTKTKLVVCPNHPEPVLEQQMMVHGNCELTALIINGESIDLDGLLKPSEENPDLRDFKLHLKDYMRSQNNSGDNIVQYERTYKFTQNLAIEPYMMGTIIRFVKGFEVRARISDGYKLYFKQTGVGEKNYMNAPTENVDGERYYRWNLASQEHLLLPGQGYILMIIPT